METAVINKQPPTGEGLTFEKVWAMFQETDRKFQETERLMKENAERQKETDQQIKESTRQMMKEVGKLGNRFGELVEHLVAPNISNKFNELGFCFTKTGMDVEIKDKQNPQNNTEVDVLLENGDIVIAVEVKSKPNEKDVKYHLWRMEVLRHYADERNDRRRYQGAIAGAIISDEMRRYILKEGFYVIEQTGDTVWINIPPDFKAREF